MNRNGVDKSVMDLYLPKWYVIVNSDDVLAKLELDGTRDDAYQPGMANRKKVVPASDDGMVTNRIKELREAHEPPLTAADLAQEVDTSQAQISRLENGKRELTEDWMRRIAKALDVEPADLLETATFVNLDNEVEPYIGTISDAVASAIRASDLTVLRVTGKHLENLGISKGYEAVFNTSQAMIGSMKTGDIALVKVTRLSDGRSAKIIRQFVSPSILITNRRGRNVTINMSEPRFQIQILGVLVKADVNSS